jgi:hypothetical protein
VTSRVCSKKRSTLWSTLLAKRMDRPGDADFDLLREK